MYFLERYASAVSTSNLKSDPLTFHSNFDCIAAAGMVSKTLPLGIALARMLSGGGAKAVIEVLTYDVYRRSRTLNIKIKRQKAHEIAIAVLGWYRYGTCQPCGGTAYRTIPGTPSLGDECTHCRGTGRMPFEQQFRQEWQPLARWLHAEIERSQAAAGIAAMKLIAPKLDF